VSQIVESDYGVPATYRKSDGAFDLSIELIANEPDWSDAEHQRFDAMRLAGFPICDKQETLKNIERPARLAECLSF
jgi:hypothetical protein